MNPPGEHRSLIGICILNWNSGEILARCVRRVLEVKTVLPLHIVVVDNCSSDSSIKRIEGLDPSVRVIYNSSNLGYARGNNRGATELLKLGCHVLVFINPDVEIDLRCLSRFLAALEADPRTGCVGGCPMTPAGDLVVAARNKPALLQKIVLYGPLRRISVLERACSQHWIFPEDSWTEVPVYAVSGACLAFCARAFCEIGGFDESTFLYEEEFIVAERLREKGWKVVLSAHARYTHLEAHCTSKMPYRRRLHFISSEAYLLRKYYRWNAILCAAIRTYRYAEWCAYALHCRFTRPGHRPIVPASVRGRVAA